MPSISKIRFTNIVYEGGDKRYNDELFPFDGHNGAILLENGGGKTVFIQTAIQAILPHADLADRKIKETLKLEDAPAHIAIEWILNEEPRRYALTCASLFLTKNGLDSFRYVYEYGENDKHSIGEVPFVKTNGNRKRPADRGEVSEYYSYMAQTYMNAHTFDTLKSYKSYLEANYHIIPKEWESIVKINSAEGGVENFFDECKTTGQLFDRLLIPTVEDSMAGFEKDEFAETFEKHRKSFKEYKLLKEKIAENERIKARLDDYVRMFAKLDLKQKEYEESKKKAKATHSLAEEQQLEAIAEQEALAKKLHDLNERWVRWHHESESYNLAVEKGKLDEIVDQLNRQSEKQSVLLTKVTEMESLYHSIRLAQYKRDFAIERNNAEFYTDRLMEFDKEADIEDIRAELDITDREIKGHFAALVERFEKERMEAQVELSSLSNRKTEEAKTLIRIEEERTDLSREHTRIETTITNNMREIRNIEKEILSNPELEKVAEELPAWERQINEYEETNIRLINRNKQLDVQAEEIGKQQKSLSQKLSDVNKRISGINAKKEHFDNAHNRLKLRLADRKFEWARLDSVYLKQDTIEKNLSEAIERLSAEREKLLHKERLAFRFVDDYTEQDIFHADPFMSAQLAGWNNQFRYIETGLSFIQSHNAQDSDYPLWPVTVVTTDNEKLKVTEKIRGIHDRLQFPVNILTMDEAQSIIDHGGQHSHWIEPKHWQSNSDRDSFATWKETIILSAEEAQGKRMEKEQEVDRWKLLAEDFLSFINQFPYSHYIGLKEELAVLDNQVIQLTILERKLNDQRENIEDELKKNKRTVEDNKDMLNGLANKTEKARKHSKLTAENESLGNEKIFISTKLSELNRKIVRQKEWITNLEQTEDNLKDDLFELKGNMDREVTFNPLYKEVQQAGAPIFTSTPIESLITKRNVLKDDIAKRSKSRDDLENYIQMAKSSMERFEREISQLRKEREDLNEQLDFPANGTEKMQELWEHKEELLPSLKQVNTEVDGWKEKHIRQQTIVEGMESNVDSPRSFDQPLELVQKSLVSEKEELLKEKSQLDSQIGRNEQQLTYIQQSIAELEKYAFRHPFLDSEVSVAILSSEERNNFVYNRKKRTKETLTELDERLAILTKALERVERSKDHYIEQSRSDIKDPRMRETAIQGIQNKHTYEDVLKYKELLENRIRVVLKYAEENIISHDKQLDQFIVHVHAHIKKIKDELKLIPKKTSVKIENQWKEIYTFSIPEWDDQQGKAAIRDYINWILDQLDREEYKDENGQDDTEKMRNSLEKWLQSKQLLRAVMKDKTMRVSCRKVTNDNKVTKATYSWEQSNIWSGGEKWSKNMTLFLGILNYVAEKRQHIQPNMKRHRTVIVDNPFGKASSDHVLNPVFFIAEQLGFQIIALTAHAEGKFLRDYFPVIYSCRLRNAEGSDKQIVTKEKSIRFAYFQDHAPKSLDRLGEHEQMELLF